MQKLITGFAAAAAVVLFASAGQACGFHATKDVTASVDKEGVAMSTYDGATAPKLAEEAAEAKAAECAEGAKCAPASE